MNQKVAASSEFLFESNKIESDDAAYVGECLAHKHKKERQPLSRLPFKEKTPLHYGMKIISLYFLQEVWREFQDMAQYLRRVRRNR